MRKSTLTVLTILLLVSSLCTVAVYGKSQNQIKIGMTMSSDADLLRYEAIIQLAQEDIQKWIDENELDIKIKINLRSNQLDTDQAIKNTRIFDKSGYDVIVGHGYSSDCDAVLDYINENDVLLLSPSSTSPQLSIPDDNLYRLMTDDTAQGRALAYYMAESGIKAVSIVYIDDAYGSGLKDVFVSECENYGIEVVSMNPVNWDHDFDTLLLEIDAELLETATNKGYSTDEIALEMAVYRYQTIPAFVAIENGDWDIVDEITWFGCDGTADKVLAEDFGEVAAQLKLICPVFGAQWHSDAHNALLERFEPLVGDDMNANDPVRYDCLRILAEAMVLAEDHYDIQQVKQALETIVTDYEGVSGLCNFNENGDRIGCDYDFWGFCESDGEYHFWRYGRYNLVDDTVEIFDEPQL